MNVRLFRRSHEAQTGSNLPVRHPSTLRHAGANVRLGELVRGVWLGDAFADDDAPSPPSLPALAVRLGSKFPGVPGGDFEDEFRGQLGEYLGDFDFSPITLDNDPLTTNGTAQDAPLVIALATGVLVRDASQVVACFERQEEATAFLQSAQELVSRLIPEIGVGGWVTQTDGDDGSGMASTTEVFETTTDGSTAVPFDLPDARACQLSKHATAEATIADGKDKIWVTASVKARHAAAHRFNTQASNDVLGMMYDSIFPTVTQRQVTEFASLAKSGLLAVIHADGNSVGKRPQRISAALSQKGIRQGTIFDWSICEAMFLRIRQSVRVAIAEAIGSVADGDDQGQRPRDHIDQRIRLLMQGGDDLLVVCDASIAVPLILKLCERVTHHSSVGIVANEFQGDIHSAFAPLALGIGVAFVKPSLPFRRAHELAEELASSAKRLATNHPGSHVVDWCISKNSWLESPDVSRRNEFATSIGDDEYLLSRRPYLVNAGDSWSLDRLWNDAKRLASDETIARSQLRRLEPALVEGPSSAVIAAQDLPIDLRQQLRKLEYLHPVSGNDLKSSVWKPSPEAARQHSTRLLDLVEMYELARLDRAFSQLQRVAS